MKTIEKLFVVSTDNILIQLIRYTVVGGLAFVVDYGVLVALTELLGMHHLVSAAIAFVAGLTVNYMISTKWVFQKSNIQSKSVEFIAYALVGVIGLGLTELFMYIFTDIVGIHYMISKLVTVALVYGWNFLARRFLIFNSHPVEESTEAEPVTNLNQ